MSKDNDINSRNWSRRIEDKVYDEQYNLVKKRYGKNIADSANYGWGSSAGNKAVSIATKVYHPKGAKVLVSEAEHPSPEISHRWDKYNPPKADD